MTTRDTAHKQTVQTIIDDAMRWRKLIRLVGIPSNGSHSKISIYWDDATHTRWVKIDNRTVLYRIWHICRHSRLNT